jgi:glycosyltransferase involved in cell wall biosynthesis
VSAVPRVSVLITAYQHDRYIARAIEGVLEQDGEVTFELLVGDDGSTDATRDIISRYAAAHPGLIHPYFPDSNLGGSGKVLFDRLIKRSRGTYIAYLDGDDYWTAPEKLSRQAAHLDTHPECAMCFHNVLVHFEDASRADALYNAEAQAHHVTVRDLLAANLVASCSPVHRRETLDPLPEWYFDLPWGDWPLHFLAARQGEIHYLPEVMGVYRIHSEGMYTRLRRLDALEALITFYERLEGVVAPSDERARRERLGRAWAERAAYHLDLGDRHVAQRCLRESFRAHPLDLRRLRRGTGEKLRLTVWARARADVLARPKGS